MTTPTKQQWIRDLKGLAQRNYPKGFGWQVLVECYADDQWLNLVSDCETYESAVDHVTSIASIYQDQHDSARAEIF